MGEEVFYTLLENVLAQIIGRPGVTLDLQSLSVRTAVAWCTLLKYGHR